MRHAPFHDIESCRVTESTGVTHFASDHSHPTDADLADGACMADDFGSGERSAILLATSSFSAATSRVAPLDLSSPALLLCQFWSVYSATVIGFDRDGNSTVVRQVFSSASVSALRLHWTTNNLV